MADGDDEEGVIEGAPLPLRAGVPSAASTTPLPSQLRRSVAPVDASASARVHISTRGSIDVQQCPATPVTPVPSSAAAAAAAGGKGGAAAAALTHAQHRLGLSAAEIAAARADATRRATSAVAHSPVVAEMRRVQAQMRSALGRDRSVGATTAADAYPGARFGRPAPPPPPPRRRARPDKSAACS